jgi:hypothetical protein
MSSSTTISPNVFATTVESQDPFSIFEVGSLNRTETIVYSGNIGLPGPPDIDSFKVYNRFNEIAADTVAKQQAVTNLGLNTIDGGTFN